MWSLFLFIYILLITGTSLANWILFDCLVKIEYRLFPLDWIKDGRPAGFFYRPSGAPVFWGSVSRSLTLRRWFSKKPVWVRNEESEKLYKYFRVTGIISLALLGLPAIAFIIVFLNQH